MPLSEYQKGYRAGYNRGASGRWPEHRPPYPPDDILAEFFRCADCLRDMADGFCATFDNDDELAIELGLKIDEYDSVKVKITEWLRVRKGGE